MRKEKLLTFLTIKKTKTSIKNIRRIVNMVLRWFEESPSDFVHGFGQKVYGIANLSPCNGTKLKESSLYFKVAGKISLLMQVCH